MPQLSTIMKQTKRLGPSAVKMAKKAGPKATAATLSKAAKARSATKDAASKVSHAASDYGHKAADTAKKVLPDKKKHAKEMASDSKSKKSSPMFGVSLTKAFLMITGSAVAALLFAPKSGKETRSDLKDHAVKMKDQGKDQAVKLKDQGKDQAVKLKDKGMDEAKGMVKNAKEKYMGGKDEESPTSESDSNLDDGVPVSPNYVTQPSTESRGVVNDTMVTDEYVSDSAYDTAVDLSVPIDEELEASSLTPEEPLSSDKESRELYEAMNGSATTTPENEL